MAIILFLFCAAGFLLSLIIGPVKTSFKDLFLSLTSAHDSRTAIFLEFRLSRAVLAFLVGASLSLSGAILQGYFQNPMADPFVVGVSSGASLGAVFFIASGLSSLLPYQAGQSFTAFVFALGAVSFVYLISERKGLVKSETLLLTGIAAGAMASAITTFILFLRSDSFSQAVFWLLGSFQLADWLQVKAVCFPFFICFITALVLARDMNLLSMGDETAAALGCPVSTVRKIFLASATLLAASAVSVSGIIGFAGLIVPHSVRFITGPDHRRLFLFAPLAGGVFLVYCDLLARTILPAELPIGVITAAFGAPFFIYLLHRKR